MFHNCSNHLSRRDFLGVSMAAAAAALSPSAFAADLNTRAPLTTPDWDRMLVLIELDGGNDGINTLIPYGDDLYYAARPSLAIPQSDIVSIGDSYLGWHPSLAPLVPLWQDGDIAIVQGLGYDAPNRSHFRGIDIWNSGSSSDVVLEDGWYGRILAAQALPGDTLTPGVLLRRSGSNPVDHADLQNIAMSSADNFIGLADALETVDANVANPSLAHLLRVQNAVVSASTTMAAQMNPYPTFTTPFPDTTIGKQLADAAAVIVAGLRVPVYKLSYGGFDTHASQAEGHAELLTELADGMIAFAGAMKQYGLWNQVLVATYSEFGRRVKENGSRGTDHGAAACHFAFGGQVTGGIYGSHPSLAEDDLYRGDIVYHTDYRSWYATLGGFVGLDTTASLGGVYPLLGFI